MHLLVKRTLQGVALLLTLPLAVLCGFGRLGFGFDFFAHSLALLPGAPGSFLRVAFYRYVLAGCSLDSVIGFGSFFSRRQAVIHPHVSIGSYCVIAGAEIGPRTQISSAVQITPPGVHVRDASGRLSSALDAGGQAVRVGADCWIGANVVVMANVGDASTIGAGSVVVKPIPAGVVAVGVPAAPLKSSRSPETSVRVE